MATQALREGDALGGAIVVFQEALGAGRLSAGRSPTPISREPFSKCYPGPLKTYLSPTLSG